MVREQLTRIYLWLGKVLIIIPHIPLPIRIVTKTDTVFKNLIIWEYVFRIKGAASIECPVKREELNAI